MKRFLVASLWREGRVGDPSPASGCPVLADNRLRSERLAAWLVAFPLTRLSRVIGTWSLGFGSAGTGLTAFAGRSECEAKTIRERIFVNKIIT